MTTFDVMGWPTLRGHYNAHHKRVAGWLDESNILQASQGTHHIEPLEATGGIKSLQIPIPGTNDNYYVEYRRPIGFDQEIIDYYEDDLYGGVFIHTDVYSNTGDTQLIDTHPLTGFVGQDNLDSVLKVGETFYDGGSELLINDPANDVFITLININDEYAEVKIGMPHCGNNNINIGEECDGNNFNGQTCQSIGYRSGSLNCNSCYFDISQCSDFICGQGHRFNGENSCTAIFDADASDGSIVASGGSWSGVRGSSQGALNDITKGHYFLSLYSNNVYPYLITRTAISFNTISIPDGATLDSAELHLKKRSSRDANTHPDSNDFITLVPVSLANPPTLSSGDFDQFSSLNTPAELSEGYDFSERWDDGSDKVIFSLNQNGLNNINGNGFSTFGLRTGYDLFASTPNNGQPTKFEPGFYSGNSNENKPMLIVNYTIATCEDVGGVDLFTLTQQYYEGQTDIAVFSNTLMQYINNCP